MQLHTTSAYYISQYSHKKEGAAWKSFVNGKQFIPDRNNVPEALVFSTLSDIAALYSELSMFSKIAITDVI